MVEFSPHCVTMQEEEPHLSSERMLGDRKRISKGVCGQIWSDASHFGISLYYAMLFSKRVQ
jgi:hypothetical protein